MYWLARPLHPLAWWLWALGLAVTAGHTTNPLLLGTIYGVACWVVLARRSDGPWAMAFRLYVVAGVLIVSIRVLFRILFGGGEGGTVLAPLPAIDLPVAAAGASLLGDITAESLLAGLYDGARLATMVVCLGAANCLANPRRLLRVMPPALHEVSTALVVAVSVFPQLAESVVRVRAARRLRPAVDTRRLPRLRALVVTVIEDALERSLMLASSMDSRGYGRSGGRSRRTDRLVGALMVTGLVGMCVGLYALLDVTTPRYLATPMLVAGVAVGVAGVGLSGRGVRRTAYRPERWRLAELVTVVSGVVPALAVTVAATPDVLHPSLGPLVWPSLTPLVLLGVLVALTPAFGTPQPAPVDAAAA